MRSEVEMMMKIQVKFIKILIDDETIMVRVSL